MALNIKNAEADRLARLLAEQTGESLTNAVVVALQERLDRERRRGTTVHERIARLRADVATLPVLDPRDADEILGYGSSGLPS